MNFDEYQATAKETDRGNWVKGTDALTCWALGVAGEGGEFADYIKKVVYHDHPLDVTRASKELGDVLWYVAMAADALGVPLNDIAEQNIAKLKARYPKGFSSEASRARLDSSDTKLVNALLPKRQEGPTSSLPDRGDYLTLGFGASGERPTMDQIKTLRRGSDSP